MLDFESQARKEIWQAKKLLYESDDHTKRSFMFSIVALVLLLLLLCFSLAGSDDNWTCEIESSNNRKGFAFDLARGIVHLYRDTAHHELQDDQWSDSGNVCFDV